MNKIFFNILFAIAITNVSAQITARTISKTKMINTATAENDFLELQIIKLPRPNSGTYSYEEASKRRNEIYNLQPTKNILSGKTRLQGSSPH